MDKVNPYHNGVNYKDIYKDFYTTDFSTQRIPRIGEVIHFQYLKGNDHTDYYGEVLYILDKRLRYDGVDIEDSETKGCTITVVMREIHPRLGEETYKSIYECLKSNKSIL